MKIVLVIFISLISFNLSAQNTNLKRISTGVKAGIELGFMSLESSTNETNSELDLGYSVLVDFLDYRFSPSWSVNLGVGFTSRNYSQRIEKVSPPNIFIQASGREQLLIQNVEVLLTARYYLTPKNKFRSYYLTGGSTIFYNLHHNAKQELFFSDGSTWEFNNPPDLKRTTYAATFGVGLELKTNYRLSYIIESIAQVNFNNISFEYGRNTNTLNSIGFLVGVKF